MSSIDDEIKQEVADNKILIYGKGTKSAPQCGFTVETIQFFNKYGHPFEVINVLDNMEKRDALSKMTDVAQSFYRWQVLWRYRHP